MRYLKVLLLFVLFTLSKCAYDASSEIKVKTHQQMQQDFSKILEDAILQAVPNAKEIKLEYIKSNLVNENQIQILFSSQFLNDNNENEEEVLVSLEGSGFLNRIHKNGQATIKWSLDSFSLGDESIQFQKEIIIEVDRRAK